MRDAVNVKDVKVKIGGKKGSIVGFYLTEHNQVYVKVKGSDGCTINHRLTDMDPDITVLKKIEE